MVMYHPQRSARGRAGYVFWSILDGAAALRIPWSDLLADGRNHPAKLEAIRVALYDFERKLGEHQGDSKKLPPMPTPHARVVSPDNTEFYAKLAARLEDHRVKEQAKRIAAGARDVARRFEGFKP